MIWLEAKGGTYEEFQAIANVLANRIASRQFPDTVEDNIFAPGQFSVADDREWFLSKNRGDPPNAQQTACSMAVNVHWINQSCIFGQKVAAPNGAEGNM